MEVSEQTVAPTSARGLQSPGHHCPSDEDGEEAANKRTSPFPYAESFDNWVADENAAPDGQHHRRETGSGDESMS